MHRLVQQRRQHFGYISSAEHHQAECKGGDWQDAPDAKVAGHAHIYVLGSKIGHSACSTLQGSSTKGAMRGPNKPLYRKMGVNQARSVIGQDWQHAHSVPQGVPTAAAAAQQVCPKLLAV